MDVSKRKRETVERIRETMKLERYLWEGIKEVEVIYIEDVVCRLNDVMGCV